MVENKNLIPIEDIVAQDPHIVKTVPAESWKFPVIDYSKFDDTPEEVDDLVNDLTDFLNKPYIVDDFTDHQTRREWRGEMEKKHVEFNNFYKSNALKKSSRNYVSQAVQYLAMIYSGESSEFARLSGEIQALMPTKITEAHKAQQEYDTMPAEEKINFVKGIKQAVYKLLESIAVQ